MKEENEYLEEQKKMLGWNEKMEDDFNKELINQLKGMSWEEWAIQNPAREVFEKPVEYLPKALIPDYCVFDEYIEAEIYRDRSEVFDECSYEVVKFEEKFYVIEKVF